MMSKILVLQHQVDKIKNFDCKIFQHGHKNLFTPLLLANHEPLFMLLSGDCILFDLIYKKTQTQHILDELNVT